MLFRSGFVKCLQDFRSPKQALINAFYNYVRKPINRITGAKVVIFCEMSKCLRRKLKDGGNFFRTLVNLFRKAILRKCTFCHEELMRSSLGVLSVVARWNKARYKKGKRYGNLNK